MNNDTNLYNLLHVNKYSSKNDIKKSFIILAKKYHPDKNKNINSHNQFIKIKSAYDILINDETRKKYDLLHIDNKQSFIDFIKHNFPNLDNYINILHNNLIKCNIINPINSKNYNNKLDIHITVQCSLLDRYLDNYAFVEIQRNNRKNIQLYVALKNNNNIFYYEGDYLNNQYGNLIIHTEIIDNNGFSILNSDMSISMKITNCDFNENNIQFTHIDNSIIHINKYDIIDNKYFILKNKGLPIGDNSEESSLRGDLLIKIKIIN
jgi:DnaJ-class molecular chaperone